MVEVTVAEWYPTTAAHAELAGLWLRVEGVELIGRDGTRHLTPWGDWHDVQWWPNSVEVHGEGPTLRLDEAVGRWEYLGRRIAANLASLRAGECPQTRQALSAQSRWRVEPAQIRAWLAIDEGQTISLPMPAARVEREMAKSVLYALPALGLMLVTALHSTTHLLVALPLLFPLLLTVLLLRRKPRLEVDEYAARSTLGGLYGGAFWRYPWRRLQRVEGARLYFSGGWLDVPPGEDGERVIRAAREILAALRGGGEPVDRADVPANALSRMRGDQVEAPVTALSRVEADRNGR